ncbi:aspartate dehydrogenase [Methanolobus sp. ZRKC3]|uniref:aspartate dehydrogenase n=1 Tax=Methanolobus sp. ZRKC3 TaxID=3125786 RepID=UPI003247CB6F
MLKIGIVGCGTIGTNICKAVDDGFIDAQIHSIYDRHDVHITKLKASVKNIQPEVMEPSEMAKHVDILVECASQRAVYEIIPAALQEKCDVMILSVGAFADEELHNNIRKIAKENDCKVYLPSGAIVGLDGLKSASVEEIYSVTLTTQKPPAGFTGAPYVLENNIDLENIGHKTVLYEGTANEAVKLFPANVNVAATLSIAGIGFDKTKVRIVANPDLTRNVHEINVKGAFGEFTTKVENIPSPSNPRSSFLAPLSAIATLKKIADPFQVGT